MGALCSCGDRDALTTTTSAFGFVGRCIILMMPMSVPPDPRAGKVTSFFTGGIA